MQDVFEIAVILRPHGIKGEIKVKPFCDAPEDFESYQWVFLKENQGMKKINVKSVRFDGGFVYLVLDGVLSRNDAEAMRGKTLYIEKSQIDSLPEDRFLIRDLIGMAVAASNGEVLGELIDIFQHGPVDVYRVEGKRGFMFPALKRVILKTDVKAGVIIVDEKALGEVAVYDD